MYHIGRDHMAIDTHRDNGLWMGLLLELIGENLGQDHRTHHLQSATSRACAAANEHQDQSHDPEERSPRHEVIRRKATRGHQGHHLKSRLAECLLPSI